MCARYARDGAYARPFGEQGDHLDGFGCVQVMPSERPWVRGAERGVAGIAPKPLNTRLAVGSETG
jgi:hypothetical protein